jgi:hypothetical protein
MLGNQDKLVKLKALLRPRESRVEFLTSKLEENEELKHQISEDLKVQEAASHQDAKQATKVEAKGRVTKGEDSLLHHEARDEVIKDLKTKMLEIRKVHQSDLKEWEEATSALLTTQDKIEAIEGEAVRNAKKARERDFFAIQRLSRAMALLKTIVGTLIGKISSLDEVVRARRNEEEYDPYEVGDMRRVYTNMLFKFRKDDELGLLVQLVNFMKERQDTKTVSQFMTTIDEQLLKVNKLGVKHVSVRDLAAMIFLAGLHNEPRKEFFQAENFLRRASDGEDEDYSSGDDKSVGKSYKSGWSKKSLYNKVKLFVQDRDDISDLNRSMEFKKPKQPHRETVKERVDESSRNIFALQDKVLALEEMIKERKTGGLCFAFLKGQCNRRGCRFLHDEAAAASEAKPFKNIQKPKKEETKVIATVSVDAKAKKKGTNDDLFVESVTIVESVCVNTAHVESEVDLTLAWDSGSGANVAGDPRIAQANKRPNTSGKVARGVGGVKRILGIADSELMQEKDFIILDGPCNENPNLLSVSKATKQDKSVFVFTEKGAVRMRLPREDMQLLADITERAVQSNNLVGRANVKNGLYVQDFGCAEEIKWSQPEEKSELNFHVDVNAVSTYNGRFIVDNMDNLIGTLLSSGLTAGTLKHAIEFQTMKGLPMGITEEAIDRYMDKFGPDQSYLEASISKARKLLPLDS